MVELEVTGPALVRPAVVRASVPPDGDAILLIRPTGVKLVGTHLDEHHLVGTVADVAYRGRGYEHAIDIPGHGRLTGVFAQARASRGESVGLRLDPEHCHIFAAAGEPPAAAREAVEVHSPALLATPPGPVAL
jgi:iron(III) transport system ATP-binding protein